MWHVPEMPQNPASHSMIRERMPPLEECDHSWVLAQPEDTHGSLSGSQFQGWRLAFLVDMFALLKAPFAARQHVVIASDPDVECGQ